MILCLKNGFSQKQHDTVHLRTIFKPIYIILSILGLFPYSVHLKSSKTGFAIIPKSIYLNFMCALANIIIMGSFLVVHIRQIYFCHEDNALTEGIMTQLNYLIELFTLVVFCLVMYICAYLNRSSYVKILNKLSALIDAPSINSDEVLRRLHFKINFVMMGSLSLLLFLHICVNFTRRDSVMKMFLVTFTFILPQMIQFTAIAFFYLLIVMLVEILRNVREHITMVEEKSTGVTKVGSKNSSLTLRQIEQIYIEAFGIKQIVNQIFEAPILVTMIQCFHCIVSESHIIYHGVVVWRNLEAHDITNCSIWIAYQVLKIYGIANAGNLFKLEAMKLGRAIYNIPTERQDLRFFLEAQHLSALMSLPGQELTVYGYFPLDATLMFKVMASAGMYIIILVQFDKKS